MAQRAPRTARTLPAAPAAAVGPDEAARPVGDLSDVERRILAVALNYPLCGIHADSLADDADVPAAAADMLIAALADDGFLVSAPLLDIDADGKQCWTVGRFSEIRDGGITPAVPAAPAVWSGPLPEWLHLSFWSHPDPATLRLPADSDYVAVQLLSEPACGPRQQGWALTHLDAAALRRARPVLEEPTRRRIDHELARRTQPALQ